MIVVLGAGLAGLSVGYHLSRGATRARFQILEREREVGGLARSIDAGGFVFDFTGHLLHLQSDHVKQMVDELLGRDQVHLERAAYVHYRGVDVPYPFQVNTAELPLATRVECVLEFANSLLAANKLESGTLEPPARRLPLSFLEVKRPTGGYTKSFADWAIATFGKGFAQHFFLDYNAKNFATDLNTISADWVSWAVPKPTLEDVLRGALGLNRKTFGYNPRFRYPASGGIRRLPEAMARGLPPDSIVKDCTVVAIDAAHKRATLSNGSTLDYTALVATNPLPELVAMIDDLPQRVRDAARALRWCGVASFNFGVKGESGHARHWIYYPEREYSFYRAGYPSNLAPGMAPQGRHSLCAEVAYPGGAQLDPAITIDRVRDELVRAGALAKDAAVEVANRLELPYAYVLFDPARREALPVIFEALLERDIVPVGRYGAWDYLSMETTILQGKETAEWLARRP
jgi:protoporphyrinogen oxidase